MTVSSSRTLSSFGTISQLEFIAVAYQKKQCKRCGKDTSNPKFCSSSCAASYNNQFNINNIKNRKKKTKQCKNCSEKIYSRLTYCPKCYSEWNKSHRGDITLQEAVDSYARHHKSSAFALVRTRARMIAKKLGLDTCVKCGYDKHVEIAHIKAISSFDMSTLISIVNAPENLMPLCPNCHWEHDHP